MIVILCDMGDPVGHETGDEADAELQDKGLRRAGHIDRIDQVRDGHSQGTGDAAVPASEDQSCQDAERVADMQRHHSAAGGWHRDLQERECHIAESGHQSREYKLVCSFIQLRRILSDCSTFNRARSGHRSLLPHKTGCLFL